MTAEGQQQDLTPLPEPRDFGSKGRLEGVVAVVTGADSGIGQGTAIEFAREGADVAITFLKDREGAEHTRREVEKLGRRAAVIHLDQRDPASVTKLFEEVQGSLGTPFVLVNNAASSGPRKEVAETTPEEWEDALRADLFGPFYCCREFIRLRRASGGRGKIVNVTSVHEEIPSKGVAAYDAAKGGVRNLTRTLALELAPDRINVNNIAPGMILTPMNQEAKDDPQKYARQVQNIPLKRAGLPWEIGRLAVYLASPDADFVHGATFTIDGGQEQMIGQGA
ncbi:SDR family NAD(P)-dependent oxidoreductase [Deinococcus yavapaiensis]|uniref:Glucose 1-dehydrogenase n=1 Tax=Deinococcus yavapaiensis KR-236 TaxID=694435 RepID=A0A318S2V4_9DEIO|nr:SDR family oxidoreductase [Deinococcus yavapaiensis]PYE52782.1 glucose 1-dehydrogenase [Deinococcus yavapaiensis KR-236]